MTNFREMCDALSIRRRNIVFIKHTSPTKNGSSNLVVSFLLLMESNSVFGSVSPRLLLTKKQVSRLSPEVSIREVKKRILV